MNESCNSRHPRRVAYDASAVKVFWEEIIARHAGRLQSEELRASRSALSKLRMEWARRLERRNEMLQGPLEKAPPPPIEPFHTEDKTAA